MITITSGFACVCSYWDTTDELEERILTYPFIASGKVLKVIERNSGTVTTIEIINIYKGKNRKKTILIYQDGSNCSLRFALNQEYLFYCYMNNSHLFTDQCTPTKLLDHAKSDLQMINK